MIFESAFGGQREFHFDNLVVSASVGKPRFRGVHPVYGLDTWLLTSKAMCIEAMETYFRTRRFCPRFREQDKASIPNSLVLHENSIRNITLHFPRNLMDADPRHGVHEMPPYMFLQKLGHFFTEHMCLSLHWEAKYFWKKEPLGFLSWPSKWNGRFRKVEVHLSWLFEGEQEMKEYGETAKTLAFRLVGDSGGKPPAISWGSMSKEEAWKDGEIVWRRNQRLLIRRIQGAK